MDKRITFGTKDDFNKKRREEFLALSDVERLELFFAAMNMYNKTHGLKINPKNFIIERTNID